LKWVVARNDPDRDIEINIEGQHAGGQVDRWIAVDEFTGSGPGPGLVEVFRLTLHEAREPGRAVVAAADQIAVVTR
jgi:hypothetical protein